MPAEQPVFGTDTSFFFTLAWLCTCAGTESLSVQPPSLPYFSLFPFCLLYSAPTLQLLPDKYRDAEEGVNRGLCFTSRSFWDWLRGSKSLSVSVTWVFRIWYNRLAFFAQVYYELPSELPAETASSHPFPQGEGERRSARVHVNNDSKCPFPTRLL